MLWSNVSEFFGRWIKIKLACCSFWALFKIMSVIWEVSLRNFAEIQRSRQHLSPLKFFQRILLLHCVKRDHHIHVESVSKIFSVVFDSEYVFGCGSFSANDYGKFDKNHKRYLYHGLE